MTDFCWLAFFSSSISDVAASRDLNDYVITEKWRDVEQALPANTKILPILMAWGNARHEVCIWHFSLCHNTHISLYFGALFDFILYATRQKKQTKHVQK